MFPLIKKRILIFTTACIMGLFFNLSMQAFNFANSGSEIDSTIVISQTRELPEEMIRDTARLITVRVFAIAPQKWQETRLDAIPVSGSGVIVDQKEIKKGSLYLNLVLTNDHISSASEEFYIQTHDGLIHKAFLYKDANFQQNGLNLDLGLVGFYSPYRYEKAVLGISTDLIERSQIFVTGFPCKLTAVPPSCPANFELTQGVIFRIDQPLKDGYQLAFTNETQEGMSGGAVINNQGKLVGINGRGKSQTTNVPKYQYANGSGIPLVIQTNPPLALGLPIEQYLKLDRNGLLDSFLRLIPPPSQPFYPIQFFKEKPNQNNLIEPVSPSSSSSSSVTVNKNIFIKIFLFTVIISCFLGLIMILLYWYLKKSGVKSQESKVRSQKSGVKSQESKVRSQKSKVRSQESGVVFAGRNYALLRKLFALTSQVLDFIISIIWKNKKIERAEIIINEEENIFSLFLFSNTSLNKNKIQPEEFTYQLSNILSEQQIFFNAEFVIETYPKNISNPSDIKSSNQRIKLKIIYPPAKSKSPSYELEEVKDENKYNIIQKGKGDLLKLLIYLENTSSSNN